MKNNPNDDGDDNDQDKPSQNDGLNDVKSLLNNEQDPNFLLNRINSPVSSFIQANSGDFSKSFFDFPSLTNSFGTKNLNIFQQNTFTGSIENPIFPSILSPNNDTQNDSTKNKIPSIFNIISNPISILPNSIFYHSNTAPYVGLLNQGSTCYMNSLLQALFHLPVFRRLVFEINDQNISKSKSDSENIPLNLKLLFAKMQLKYDNKAISTEDLTTSFGWKQPQTFMQHDVQEFSRVLLENLEDKMKGTPLEKSIKYIFGGNYITYIYTYSKNGDIQKENFINNEFLDISLDVTSDQLPNNNLQSEDTEFQANPIIDDIYSAFDKYTEEEKLSGDNQYQFEEKNKKDAFIRNKFIKMPRVLYLHLKRFQIDLKTNQSVKINSFFRFYKTINLTKYVDEEIVNLNSNKNEDQENSENSNLSSGLDENENIEYQYDLYGVLVHSGTSMSGHYMVYLNTEMDDKWYQFNDSNVTEVDEESAIDKNFGGVDITFSAYMLIYVKRTEKENLFHEVEDEAIPSEIIERIKKERSNSTDSISSTSTNSNANAINNGQVIFYLFNEETTVKKNALFGKLSFSCDREYATQLPIFKSNSLKTLYQSVAQVFQTDESQIELWPQFLNEGLIEKFENNSFKDLTNYPESMNVFVFIKQNDEDISNNNNNNNDDQNENKNNLQFDDDIFSFDNDNKNNSISSSSSSSTSFMKYSISEFLNEISTTPSSSSSLSKPPTFPIFIFTYCSLSKNPFTFLSSYEVDGNRSIYDFLALVIQKKVKKAKIDDDDESDENINLDYIKSIMNVYIKKSNNLLEEVPKTGQESFSSFVKNDEIYKSSIFVIELDDWSRFEIPSTESDSYAMDIYLSQKKLEKNENNLYNYFDFIYNGNLMNVVQYYNYINDLNRLKIISFGKKIIAEFPNLISFNEFKNFLKKIFENEIKNMIQDNHNDESDSLDYDELIKMTEVLIFRANEVTSIVSNSNDPMLTILTPNDQKLKVKFIDPSLLLIDDQITSFLLLDVFVSFDSINVHRKVEEFVNNESIVSDIIELINEIFFLNEDDKNKSDEFEIRVLQLDTKGRKILRIIDPSEKVSSLSNPIRIEKVTTGENINESYIKVSFEKKLKFEPFVINMTGEMKISSVKEIITENAEIQKRFKKHNKDEDDDDDGDDDKNTDDLIFSFFNEKGEKMSNLNDDAMISDFSPQLTEIFVERKKSIMLIDRAVHLYN